MVSLGIILLVVGVIVAIACCDRLANIAVGVRIGFGVAILGGALIIVGYLIPVLGNMGDGVDEPDRVGMTSLVELR